MAQAPNPTGVICKSELPSFRRFMIPRDANFQRYCSTPGWMRFASEKLERGLAGAGCRSVHGKDAIEDDGFAVRVADGEPLRVATSQTDKAARQYPSRRLAPCDKTRI